MDNYIFIEITTNIIRIINALECLIRYYLSHLSIVCIRSSISCQIQRTHISHPLYIYNACATYRRFDEASVSCLRRQHMSKPTAVSCLRRQHMSKPTAVSCLRRQHISKPTAVSFLGRQHMSNQLQFPVSGACT